MFSSSMEWPIVSYCQHSRHFLFLSFYSVGAQFQEKLFVEKRIHNLLHCLYVRVSWTKAHKSKTYLFVKYRYRSVSYREILI